MESFMDLLAQLTDLFESADGVFASLAAIVTAVVLVLEAVVSFVGLVGLILAAVVTLVCALALYVARAVPTFVLARKVGCKQAWLAWIPVFQPFLCTFLLYRIGGKEEFCLFGKLRIKQGVLVMLGYVLLQFFGSDIVKILSLAVNVIPVFGQAASLLLFVITLLPTVLIAAIEYVYLRDAINRFKPDEKANRIHAVAVVVLDTLITGGWAQVVYQYTMIKLQPLYHTVWQGEETGYVAYTEQQPYIGYTQ